MLRLMACTWCVLWMPREMDVRLVDDEWSGGTRDEDE